MKLADDALLGIMGCFRKGLLEETDISQLLREMELCINSEGRLGLAPGSDSWLISTEVKIDFEVGGE